ncbi:acyl carrier protein [Burkholderia theae]|uniref:Acyl carrier protein n=1 Tax=Burkholderia theae TaxID=3143496 RepID=A0ABU9WF57_9BURK|nr:acyl carrier protein [Burkholderia sp. Z1]
MQSMEQIVHRTLAGIMKQPGIRGDQDLTHDLRVDSLAFIQIVAELEQVTGIRFEDEDLVPELFRTVDDLTRYLANRQPQ